MAREATTSLGSLSRRAKRAIVVVDVVESVRLMELNADEFLRRWLGFVADVQTALLPQHGGRLVKSLGDGLMLEFESVPSAIQCALAMHSLIAQGNQRSPVEQCLYLRIGANVADVVVDEHDIYGPGVNLAARIGTLAGPGDIVVTAEVRDLLVPGLDAEAEDLGECYLKHMPNPVRPYRLRPVTATRAAPLVEPAWPLSAGVAVLAFKSLDADPAHAVLGDLLADEVIGRLSRCENLHVISRLSSLAFSGRSLDVREIGQSLRAAYIASGTLVVVGTRVRLRVELARTEDQCVVWSESLLGTVEEVLLGTDPIVPAVASSIAAAIVQQELARSSGMPLPNLQSHSLLMASIGLIHRSSVQDFERSHEILEHLAQRHPRLPQPLAWLGKWHAMRMVQGLCADPAREARRALDAAHRALDSDSHSSLALTMAGLVHGFIFKDLAMAESHYDRALASNPNETLAWMYLGVLRAWQGRGEEAWRAVSKGIALSPLDPMSYYFDTMAAFVALVAGRHRDAHALAQRSLRANRLHTATHRTLAIAQWMGGDEAGARATVADMLHHEPGFSTARYLDRFPGGQTESARDFARILRAAGASA